MNNIINLKKFKNTSLTIKSKIVKSLTNSKDIGTEGFNNKVLK